VPDPGALREADQALLDQGQGALKSVGESIAACHFREGLRAALAYAQDSNRYLNQEEPWKTRATDRPAAARSLYTALCAIEALKLMFYPYLPFSSQKLHEMLGRADAIGSQGWSAGRLVPGTPLQEPKPLYKKLEVAEPAS
jgi:methionyl-tRNA synthetase